jgi:hypothetical protein
MDPAGFEAGVQFVTKRAQDMLAAGQRPEWIFIGQISENDFLCFSPNEQQRSLLLFTSPVLVTDYFQAIGKEGRPAGIRIDSITELPKGWPELGVHSFCLNRCPRCNVFLTYGFEGLSSLEAFLKIWALERATRFLKGQRMARRVADGQGKGMAEMKVALEQLRDHAAADNAHVYQLLAMIGRSLQDAATRAAALARLEELRLPVKLETDDVAQGFAEGLVGLFATFELIQIPKDAST